MESRALLAFSWDHVVAPLCFVRPFSVAESDVISRSRILINFQGEDRPDQKRKTAPEQGRKRGSKSK